MVFKVVVRGREVNAFQSLEQAMEEVKAFRELGEGDVKVVAVLNGGSCFDLCVGAGDVEEYLACLSKCEEGVEVTLPPPLTQELDDLGV